MSKKSKKVEQQPASESNGGIDIESLRLSQDFSEVGAVKVLTTIPVRRPDRAWFVRTHPSSEYMVDVLMLTLDDVREPYIIGPALRDELADDATTFPCRLVTAINRSGLLFLWYVKLPRGEGRINSWTRSDLLLVEMAQTRWLRRVSNRSGNVYECFLPKVEIPDPTWDNLPDSMQGVIDLVPPDHFLNEKDHPVYKQLKGLA